MNLKNDSVSGVSGVVWSHKAASLSQSRSNKSECLFVQKIGSVVSLAGPVLL